VVSVTDPYGRIIGFLDGATGSGIKTGAKDVVVQKFWEPHGEARGSLVVKGLGYQPEGGGFETR
jgi:hypothetical protein